MFNNEASVVAWADAELGSHIPPVSGWRSPSDCSTASPTLLCRTEERELSEAEMQAEVGGEFQAALGIAPPMPSAAADAAPAAASAKADGQWWHVGIGCSRCIHRLIIPHDPHRPPPHLM